MPYLSKYKLHFFHKTDDFRITTELQIWQKNSVCSYSQETKLSGLIKQYTDEIST
jgi:hypothetical protein